MFKSEYPIVDGVNWLYWDLEELGQAIQKKDVWPKQVLQDS